MAVAAFASWHESHQAARAALEAGEPGIVAHAALETYSVLTRLPPPHRARGGDVVAFLEDTFGDRFYKLPGGEHRNLLRRVADEGIQGGAIYDALIGAVAASVQATLVTRDTRAARTYDRIGAGYRLLP